MHKFIASAAAVLAALSVVGCADEPVPAQPAPIVFEGLQLRGIATDAKARGFTACEPMGSGYLCKRQQPTILLGVPVREASVQLVPPHGQQLQGLAALEAMRFAGVQLYLPATQYDQACVERHRVQVWQRPIQCRQSDAGADFLAHRLTEAGWLETARKRTRRLIHPQQMLSISVDPAGLVSLHELSAEHRDIELAIIQAARDRRDEQSRAIDQIKQ